MFLLNGALFGSVLIDTAVVIDLPSLLYHPTQARFQGQFLNDEDVGQKPAPKKEMTAGGMTDPIRNATSGSSKVPMPLDGAFGSGSGSGGADSDDSLASRRQRLGLGEGRRGGVPRSDAEFSGSARPQSQLLEIKPKKKKIPSEEAGVTISDAQSDSPPSAATQSAHPAGSSRVGSGSGSRPLDKRPAAAPPPLRLRLTPGDDGINDDEFQQSLRMRSSVDYIHPSVVGMLSTGPKEAAAAAPVAAARRPKDAAEVSNVNPIPEEDIPIAEARSSMSCASSELIASGLAPEASASRMRAEASKRATALMGGEGVSAGTEAAQDEVDQAARLGDSAHTGAAMQGHSPLLSSVTRKPNSVPPPGAPSVGGVGL